VSPHALTAALALAALAGGGCTSISLRASEARTPILLGPVACIGCAPEPARTPSTPAVDGGVRSRQYIFPLFGSYADKVARETTPLDVAADQGISDPCRQDLHVDHIHAGTWGFDVPILFAIEDVWIEVQASPAAVSNGTCGRTREGRRP
jgi:hypothetical protein